MLVLDQEFDYLALGQPSLHGAPTRPSEEPTRCSLRTPFAKPDFPVGNGQFHFSNFRGDDTSLFAHTQALRAISSW